MRIVILFLLFSFCAHSQNPNFKVEDGLINWNYVYEDSTSVSELKNKQLLEFKTDTTGYIKKTNFNNKHLRFFVAEFKIESKKNKYRVSVFNIVFDSDNFTMSSGGLSLGSNPTYTIETAFLKKDGTIKKTGSFGYNITETLNPHFVDLFTIKKKLKSEW
jgi:hypothetical protein